MGIVKRAADLAYTFRLIRMLVMDWTSWDAYKEGVIDEKGKRIKSVPLDTDEKKSSYTPFIRLCANIKRLVSKIPGGGTKLGSFVSALFLIKEKYNMSDKQVDNILEKLGMSQLDFLSEQTEWFVTKDRQLSPGIYRVREEKVLNKTCDDVVKAKDKIRIEDNCFPVNDLFGIDIYEAIHLSTRQTIYVTASEIYK
jgi:hypothetical protein